MLKILKCPWVKVTGIYTVWWEFNIDCFFSNNMTAQASHVSLNSGLCRISAIIIELMVPCAIEETSALRSDASVEEAMAPLDRLSSMSASSL